MSVFDEPGDLKKDIEYTMSAPWTNKNLPFDSGWDNPGKKRPRAFSRKEDKSVSVKNKLNLLQLTGVPLALLSLLIMLGGFGTQLAACGVGKGSHRAHYYIVPDSFWYSVLVALGIIVVGFLIFCFAGYLLGKCDEIFKREIVRNQLEQDSEIIDYIYNEETSVSEYATLMLKQFGIRNNLWDKLSYNDYIVGKYHNAPFIFFDCKIETTVKGERNSSDYLVFKGQVIVLKMNKKLPYSEQFFFNSGKLVTKHYTLSLRLFEELLNGEKRLKDQTPANALESSAKLMSEHLEQLHEVGINLDRTGASSDTMEKYKNYLDATYNLVNSVKQSDDSKSDPNCCEYPDNIREFLMPMQPHLDEVVNNAQCHVGWIIDGQFLAIILENGFDPFEFGFSDIFRSYNKVSGRVCREVEWLYSILEPHVQVGLI